MDMWYKAGYKLGPRYCQLCGRPAEYSETQQKWGREKDVVVYRCGYHSPFRGIDSKTKQFLTPPNH